MKQITLRYVRCSFLFRRDTCGPWCGAGGLFIMNERLPAFLYTPAGQYCVIFTVINLSPVYRSSSSSVLFIFFLFFFRITSCFISCTEIHQLWLLSIWPSAISLLIKYLNGNYLHFIQYYWCPFVSCLNFHPQTICILLYKFQKREKRIM